jgi:hypothetical protein
VGTETERELAENAAAATAALAEEVGLEPEIAVRHGASGEKICAAAGKARRDHPSLATTDLAAALIQPEPIRSLA